MTDPLRNALERIAPEVDLAHAHRRIVQRRRSRVRARVFMTTAILAGVIGSAVWAAQTSNSPSGQVTVAGEVDETTTSASEIDDTSTSVESPTVPETRCALEATFVEGPPGWDMTVLEGPGEGGGPPGWWHIDGPEEGTSIQILRGTTPFPRGDNPSHRVVVDGVEAVLYPIHDGMSLSIAAPAGTDPSCGELHILAWGVREQELLTIAAGIRLMSDS